MADLNPNIILAGRGINLQGAFNNALAGAGQLQALQQQRQQAPVRNQLLEQRVTAGQQLGQQRSAQNRQGVQREIAIGLSAMKQRIDAGDIPGANAVLDGLGLSADVVSKLRGGFVDDAGNPETLETLKAEIDTNLQALTAQQSQLSSVRQREFEALTEGLSEEDKEKARRIRLRLDPGAVGAAASTVMIGGVPHIFDRVEQRFIEAEVGGEKVTTKTVAKSKSIIESNVVTARENAKNSAGIVKENYDKIQSIAKNMRNLDKAIAVLKKPGAKTGAIERFLPSITAAAVELDNIRKELGLDVVGGTTFGALSKGELDLALEVALPVGLDEPELIKHLEARKAAQLKLTDFLNEGIRFLGGVDEDGVPNTIAGFVEFQESKRPGGAQGGQPGQFTSSTGITFTVQ